jgi:hypothetical protein
MKRLVCAAAVVPALYLAAGVGLAHADAINIGQIFTGGLADIVNSAVSAAILAGVGWLAIVIKSKFNIDIEARHREALTAFLQRQASGLVAAGAVKLEGLKVEVSNASLAAAANTAIGAIPQAMAWFGLTPAKIEGMIVDLLPKQPAVAAAAAVAIDVKNPATPSTSASAPPPIAVAAGNGAA